MPTKARTHLDRAITNNFNIVNSIIGSDSGKLEIVRKSNYFTLYFNPFNSSHHIWIAYGSSKKEFNNQLCSIISALTLKNAINLSESGVITPIDEQWYCASATKMLSPSAI